MIKIKSSKCITKANKCGKGKKRRLEINQICNESEKKTEDMGKNRSTKNGEEREKKSPNERSAYSERENTIIENSELAGKLKASKITKHHKRNESVHFSKKKEKISLHQKFRHEDKKNVNKKKGNQISNAFRKIGKSLEQTQGRTIRSKKNSTYERKNKNENKIIVNNEREENVMNVTNNDDMKNSGNSEMSDINGSEINDSNSNEINDINSSEINDINSSEINDINSSEINDINSSEINDINSSEINDINSSEINDINSSEINDINSSEINDINSSEINDINSSEINDSNSEICKNCEPTELENTYESDSELLEQSSTCNSSLTVVSVNTEEDNNINSTFIGMLERVHYGEILCLSENNNLMSNPNIMETFEIHKVFDDNNDNDGDKLNCMHLNSKLEESNIDDNKSGEDCLINNEQNIYENSNKSKQDKEHSKEYEVKKRIIQNEISRKILLFLPFYKKRIFIDAITEYFEKEGSKNRECRDDLKTQCYDIIKEIHSSKTSDGTPFNNNNRNNELLNKYFCEKLNNNKYDIKLEMDYYEFEFFCIFFLTYFRFLLYLSGFINSSFLYHSNEIHFNLFVLNRYHYFVDHFYLNDDTSPFTHEEAKDIICTYKKCIICVLDYLDAFYPFLLLIYNVITYVHRRSKRITQYLERNEILTVKNNNPDKRCSDGNFYQPNSCIQNTPHRDKYPIHMTTQIINKFDIIKKINKIKRKFFKRNYNKFMLMITEKLSNYWVNNYAYDELNDVQITVLDYYIEKMILNIKNNMFIKYIICSIVLKLNSILSKLEKKSYSKEEEQICTINILTISTLLKYESLKKMKKKDKWLLLLKHNYFYIEKSYYFFKELHEKKIIYYQIQNLFRSILKFKINIVHNPFIQYFYITDFKNKNMDMIYDYIYRINSNHQKDTIITLFIYKRLIYKLHFNVTYYGLLYSIYNSLKFLFLEKSYIYLIKNNNIMKNKFMYLFNTTIKSLNFEIYKNVVIPTKNIVKNYFFNLENTVIKNILLHSTKKLTQMRFRGHTCTYVDFSCHYEKQLSEELFRFLQNDRTHKVDKYYLVKEMEQIIKQIKNKL
ncbi:hypothetical protein MKS88_000853 [Plasmodium brasilianum]|uniref:Uncharacterized protein n=1 Tax=Plasmodium brasilianum TaxID=5824 RepID=A0ACB9YDY1_PLABR|nr:hypothetical protein MKS88_000853 [Plasmodium brasilianum]